MKTNRIVLLCCIALGGVVVALAATSVTHAGEGHVFTASMVQDAKQRFALAQVEVAAVNKQASGVIKEEDLKTGKLLLLVDQVCADKGGTAVGFIDPYCKTPIDPVDCGNGRMLPRYRVQQRACGQQAH